MRHYHYRVVVEAVSGEGGSGQEVVVAAASGVIGGASFPRA